MCKAFSCIIAKSGKVYWKAGKDSHEYIKQLFKLSDLKADADFVCIEITPKDGRYLYPDRDWILRFDNKSYKAPDWWKASHDKASFEALKKWKKEVYSLINLEEARNPVHPFKLPERKPTKSDIRLLKKWDSVRDSVRDSVGGSVWDSVGGYASCIFKIRFKFDFSCCVKLWKRGLVPSFDGHIWRLHSGEKAKIVFEINKEDLQRYE